MNVIQKEEHILILSTKNKQRRVTVRWDGCCHIDDYSNGTTWECPTAIQDRDYLHICNLAEFIEQLQECQKKAIKHFGKEWPL